MNSLAARKQAERRRLGTSGQSAGRANISACRPVRQPDPEELGNATDMSVLPAAQTGLPEICAPKRSQRDKAPAVAPAAG
jgi:hypothetical protein